jgi:hypothetical protein
MNQAQRRGECGGSRMSLERTVGVAKNASAALVACQSPNAWLIEALG